MSTQAAEEEAELGEEEGAAADSISSPHKVVTEEAGLHSKIGTPVNKFSALSSVKDGDSHKDEEADFIEMIQQDMESWESSGQWMFSCYSVAKEKPNLLGFEDFSPEELRLECYRCRADGNLQNYMNAVHQLTMKWSNRLQELKNPSTSVKATLSLELKKPVGESKLPSGFGGVPAPSFGSASFPTNDATNPTTFSFKPQSDFASPAIGSTPTFGDASAIQGHLAFPSAPSAPGPVGFGNLSTSSTSVPFGFGSGAPSGFGALVNSGFGERSATIPAPGFGTLSSASSTAGTFGSAGTTSGSSLFGQQEGPPSSSAGNSSQVSTSSSLVGRLLTPLNELSADELKQFQAKRFTLGRIPLKPPPAELLVI
ncbi:hypothetical protein NDU88_005802 [Pleurodeles waltl]|uniref:Uncharacterized protein n=1 Tax=Pleurodeles waltl TaxID=8319 RepID=A0AAV7MBM8_PLEWA|nr:hypothetical protein NDU88_005802 [Pleurodeles waltl]